MMEVRTRFIKHEFVLFRNENNVQVSFLVNIVGSIHFVLIKNSNKWAKRFHDLNLKIINMNIISEPDIINLAYKHIVWNLNKTII